MPRRAVRLRAPEGAPQGRRTSPRAGSHQEHVQQHHHLDHRPPGPSSRGPRPARSASKGSRKSTPFAAQLAAEAAARRAMEHGMRKVDVFVKGPVPAGRPRSGRSPRAIGLEVGAISDVTPSPHNGVRPSEAPSRLTREGRELMARYTGPITKKSRRLGSTSSAVTRTSSSARSRPASTAVAGSRRRSTSPSLQEKQKARFTYGVSEKQFIRYYREAASRPSKTGENLLTILESRLDNVIYRAGAGPPGATPVSSSATATSWSTASASTCPPTGSSSTTSSRSEAVRGVGPRSGWPARRGAGDRPVPAWIQVVPGGCDPHPPGADRAPNRHGAHRAAHRRALFQN